MSLLLAPAAHHLSHTGLGNMRLPCTRHRTQPVNGQPCWNGALGAPQALSCSGKLKTAHFCRGFPLKCMNSCTYVPRRIDRSEMASRPARVFTIHDHPIIISDRVGGIKHDPNHSHGRSRVGVYPRARAGEICTVHEGHGPFLRPCPELVGGQPGAPASGPCVSAPRWGQQERTGNAENSSLRRYLASQGAAWRALGTPQGAAGPRPVLSDRRIA
jgi:hypothetical protein